MSRPPSDAFADAVYDALRRLGEREGRSVSVNELARRADVPRSNLHWHLNAAKRSSDERRRVPAKLVAALAKVLPISQAELMRAAQMASGLQVRETGDELPDLRNLLARHIDAAEGKRAKLLVIADMQHVLATESARVLAQEGPL